MELAEQGCITFLSRQIQGWPSNHTQNKLECMCNNKNAITSSLKQFSIKVMIRWLASATRLEMYGNEIDTCHLCTMQETNYHIFQCSYRTRAFLMRHKALQTFLNSIQTPNELIEPIANCILYWALQTQNPTNLIALQQSYPNVIAWLNHQTTLGWNLATFGHHNCS